MCLKFLATTIKFRAQPKIAMKIKPILQALICASTAGILLWLKASMITKMMGLGISGFASRNLINVTAALLIVEAARMIIIAFYKPQGGLRRDNFTAGIGHLTKIIYAISFLVLLLSLFDVSVKEAITSLSLIAAAIVLMTKDYISNLINGMYITFTKLVNIGDNVKIDDHKGKIMDITLTNVHLLNDDDDIIYIPNNLVFTGEIINFTRRELKKSYVDFELRTEDLIPVPELEKAIIASLGPLDTLVQANSYNLKVASIKHEFTAFKFQFILQDPLNKEHDKKLRRHIIQFVVAQIANNNQNRAVETS
jgi:small-conductance mechanosensitive channel